MENNLQNTILDNSNNILDLNSIENIVINNTNNYINNQENFLNFNEIDLPLERTIPVLVRQQAFNYSD